MVVYMVSGHISVYGHISNGAQAVPGRYVKFEVSRCPSTTRTGHDRLKPTCIRAPFDEEVHRSASGFHGKPPGLKIVRGREICEKRSASYLIRLNSRSVTNYVKEIVI